MSESTYRSGRRTPGDPQITGGGGHEPDPSRSATTSGVGREAQRRGRPGTHDDSAGYDLKSSDLPEPTTPSGT